MLNKNDLIAIQLKTKKVKIQDIGEVTIKEFTTSAREEFEVVAMKIGNGESTRNMKAKLIAISLITPEGGRMFGDDELDKIAMMPSVITEHIFNEILALNGMGDITTGND